MKALLAAMLLTQADGGKKPQEKCVLVEPAPCKPREPTLWCDEPDDDGVRRCEASTITTTAEACYQRREIPCPTFLPKDGGQ